jgi:hypothetical protein
LILREESTVPTAVLEMLDGLGKSFGALQGFPWRSVDVRYEAEVVASFRAAY